MNEQLITFEYGSMSSLYSLEAKNKFTAYASMVYHYGNQNHLIALYEPKWCKEDSWINPFGVGTSARLDEIFGGENSFDKYVESNVEEIKECMKTIKQLS